MVDQPCRLIGLLDAFRKGTIGIIRNENTDSITPQPFVSHLRKPNLCTSFWILLLICAGFISVLACNSREDPPSTPTPTPPIAVVPPATPPREPTVLQTPKQCGEFENTSKPLPDDIGSEYKVLFKFTPHDCGNNCRCGRIAYVQIARVVLHDGTYYDDGNHTSLIVSGQDGENSQDLNGWFIDTWVEAKYGHYARISRDGFDNDLIGLGSNVDASMKAAWLFDRPLGLPKDSLVEFIDAPVCLDSNSTCPDRLLGFSYWWFTVSKDGNPPSIDGPNSNLTPAEERLTVLKKAIKLSVQKWNSSSEDRGPNIKTFPIETKPLT